MSSVLVADPFDVSQHIDELGQDEQYGSDEVLELESYASGYKDAQAFRNYSNSDAQIRVEKHYRSMRSNQTMAFLKKMEEKYYRFDKCEMTVWEAFDKLDTYVDASDPDSDNPNLFHMLQTAEAIRKCGYPDWMQLTGLLHDLGKIMFLWGTEEDGQMATAKGPQWALGGDTWVLGAAMPNEGIVFPEFNQLNPDMSNPMYNTKYGIYNEGIGFKHLNFAFGHDEYMYRMLLHNNCKLPEEALMVIRLHSCYPWHNGKNYRYFMSEQDFKNEEWVLKFNSFDLYTKADSEPDVEALRPYYQSLIDKYIPGKLHW